MRLARGPNKSRPKWATPLTLRHQCKHRKAAVTATTLVTTATRTATTTTATAAATATGAVI